MTHPTVVHILSTELGLEPDFVTECLAESVLLVEEVDGKIEIRDATLLRLRRVQRLCLTFNVNVSAALLMLNR